MPVVAKDVTSHGGANRWLRRVVVKGALRLLCLSCGLKTSIHLCVWFSKLMWSGSGIDWVGGVLSCTRRAPHEHLPSCGTPPHHVRAVRAPSEKGTRCNLMERDMANQDVARRREIKQDVDAVQRVGARQNTKSAAKPMSGPSNTNGQVG